MECEICGVRNEVHEMIFGKGLIDDLCVVCSKEVDSEPKGEVFRKDPNEWSPEIVEAMRIPH